ncbi:MAG: hypothetical protein GY866_02225 [Proteobacteria bacterium]|nr:hypothetical protein [Pseudomonadota bacterium]
MKGFDNQAALRIKTPEINRRVDSALGLSRGDPKMHKEYISHMDQGRFSMIGKLENSVSMLQTASVGIEKIKGWLNDMKRFLEEEGYRSFRAQIPVSVINNFLTDRLAHIKMISETTSFQERALLNGKCGVKGETTGNSLHFVRGSARVVSCGSPGYPLAIYQTPQPSTLSGNAQLSPQNLKRESIIALADESQEIRYRIRGSEDPNSLVANLQRCLIDHGFDISVYRTGDNCLFFRHNQLGSSNVFKGMSYNSRIVSDIPGKFKEAESGKDIIGTIGSEQAHGDGGYLVGGKGNRKTDGLAVYYDGTIEYPGQIIGYISVEQNGIMVPVDLVGNQVEILSIPSMQPEMLASGVSNRSGFTSLASVRANTVEECRDALKLIMWSITYLEYLQEELKWKETSYVERAVELLRSTMLSKTAGEEILYLSKEKAKSMVNQLKTMLNPAVAMKVSSWR